MNTHPMFSSESVTAGHPDKLCDQVSDAIVDGFLQQDPLSRISAECAVSTGILFVAARFRSHGSLDVPGLARDVIRDLGYDEPSFDARACSVMTSLVEHGHDEATPGDERDLDDEAIERIRATDQVTLFGFACNHTPARLPVPIWLANRLARRLADVKREGKLPYLSPDGKTQVGVELRGRQPYRLHGVGIVASRSEGPVALSRLRDDLTDLVLRPVFESEELQPDARTRVFINPDDEIPVGGPSLHSGLTGRKTAADLYGEYARHSGAALSGKDPGRIDRVGAYAARHAAVNVVAAELADECELQLSYSIGRAGPVSLQVETFGSGRIPDAEIARRVAGAFDFRLGGIVRAFDLRWLPGDRRGRFYRDLAAYGHVGRPDLDLPWERTDRVDALREG